MLALAKDAVRERREAIAALALALAIHILLVFGVGWFFVHAASLNPPVPQDAEPIRLVIAPPEPQPARRPVFVPSQSDETPARKPHADAPFESDRDSVAASESAPSGNEPLPTVDGRNEDGIALRDQKHSLGRPDRAPAPAVPQESQPAAQASSPPKPREDAAPLEKPQPDTPPAPKTKPVEKTARPATPAAAGFRPETRVVRLRGNVNNRGRASLEANATPLGRYKKQVSDAIGSRWYYYVNSQAGLVGLGTTEVRFTVEPSGKARGARVIRNTSNESLASISIASIVNAEIPPIPPEVAKLLDNGRLEIDYSFTVLAN